MAETVRKLEVEIGWPARSLQSAVDLCNRHATEGSDLVLGNKSDWVKRSVGAFAAIDLRGSAGGFTLGGATITVDSEVLHVTGAPIPGLFARVPSGCALVVTAVGQASATAASSDAAPESEQCVRGRYLNGIRTLKALPKCWDRDIRSISGCAVG